MQLRTGLTTGLYLKLEHTGWHYHFAIGALVVLLIPNKKRGLLVSLFLGVGKEIFDAFGHGTVDAMDVLFTALPSIMAVFFRSNVLKNEKNTHST